MTAIEVLAVIGGGTGLLGLVAVFYLAVQLSGTKDERETARVDLATTKANLATTTANLATQTNRGDSEKARGDALDTVIEEHLDAGPADGAFDRLRLRWKAARLGPADITSTRVVPAPSKADAAGSDGLMRPGD